MHSLTPRIDNIVVTIEELKDLASMSKEELKSSLEAHEQCMEDRNNDKEKTKIALQARFNENDKRSKVKWPLKNRGIFRILVEKSPKI